MRKYLKKNIFILLSLLIYVVAFFIDKNQVKVSKINVDIDYFEQTLHNKEQELKNIVDSVETLAQDFNFEISINKKPLYSSEQLDILDEKGFSILVYKNDSLVYWSDNLFEVSKKYDENEFTGQCVFLPDYWLDITKTEVRDYKIIGAYRIKTKYQKKNKYLQNNFHKDLKLPASFKISLIPLSYGIDVTGSNNEYLLSLIPNNNVYTDYKLDIPIGIMLLLSFLLLLFQIYKFIEETLKSRKGRFKAVAILIIMLGLRIFMIYYKTPHFLYTQSFFDSQYFANSFLCSSLGDLLLNLMLILLCTIVIFEILSRKEKPKNKNLKSEKFKDATIIFSTSIIFLSGIRFVKNFVINSNISLNIFHINNLNSYSFIGYLNILLVIFIIVLICFKTLEHIFDKKPDTNKLMIFLPVLLAFIAYSFAIGTFKNISEFLVLIVFILVFVVFIKKKKTKSLYFFGSIMFLSAIVITYCLISSLILKNRQNKELITVELTNEKDDVAELLLNDIAPLLPNDQTLQAYAQNLDLPNIENDVKSFLRRRYFKTYWNKYDINVQICNEKNDTAQQNLKCNLKYLNLFQQNGQKLNRENVFYISYNNGKTAYIIQQPYEVDKNDSAMFYITLAPKLYPTDIGYPELLLDENVEIKKIPDYSYAKYENNEIVQKIGEYSYPRNGENMFSANESIEVKNHKKFKHIIYTLSEGDYIVLTYKKISVLDILIAFAYVFLLLILITAITYGLLNFKKIIRIKNFNFRTKLIFAMLIVLSLSFSLVGIVTILFNVNQYKAQHQQEIINKLNQISIAIEQLYLIDEKDLLTPENNKLNFKLRQLSETFGTDINLYDSIGGLLATSRPEIYDLKLVAKRVYPQAMNRVIVDSDVQFILDEKINLLHFSSAYAQFVNSENKMIGIINMPYFTNPEALRIEISNLIISIINIYVLLFVVAMLLSVFISEQIISPLIVLHGRFTKLELGKTHEKIEYKRKDEIGKLVDEYNKMVDKLNESIEKLAKSERESAWRDMAKQIAHEIKNPLTPMKLSIQLLMRSWENQDDDFDARIRAMSNTLIDQIETLRRIAEEFSDFAKMPKPIETVINLGNVIEEVCKLYENTGNVEVIPYLHNYRKAIVFADKKQIARALINLIKNAIQAIAEGVNGKIIIELDVYGEKAIVKVIDNGTGIPEEAKDKLFIPSFTTKSSGMGLGLPMVKNIVKNAKGKISFYSTPDKGTTFTIEFPLHHTENKTPKI